ncbi:MAG: family transcriptional regulator [Acidimicrobiales bacterium]|nr:family transcriptional regulator [Acidimicrobiales bacterium]
MITFDRAGSADTTEPEEVVAAADAFLAELSSLSAGGEGAVATTIVGRMRAEGVPFRDILSSNQSPLLELTKTRLDTVQAAASRFRRATARALHTEGVAMDQIGVLLGVTRQRVSVLVHDTP